MLALHHPVTVTSEKDAFALAHCFGLHDEGLGSFVVELLFETFGVGGQNPCVWEKVVQVGHGFLHCGEVSG